MDLHVWQGGTVRNVARHKRNCRDKPATHSNGAKITRAIDLLASAAVAATREKRVLGHDITTRRRGRDNRGRKGQARRKQQKSTEEDEDIGFHINQRLMIIGSL